MFVEIAASPETAAVSPSGASTRGSHRLAAVAVCPRMWALRYVVGLRLKDEPTWRLQGTLIHLCLAYHYAAILKNPPNWYHEKSLDEALAEKGIGRPGDIRLAKEILEAYRKYYALDAWEPLQMEEELSATIGELDPGGPDSSLDNEVVSCRPDLIIQTGAGKWVVDYKSQAGQWGSAKLERWRDDGEYRLNWQVLVNLHVARRRLTDVRGFIIQRIRRKEPYDFDRHVLSIPEEAYKAVPRVARGLVAEEREIRRRMSEGVPPSPHFWACYGRFGPCDYMDFCTAKKESRNNILGLLYTEEGK